MSMTLRSAPKNLIWVLVIIVYFAPLFADVSSHAQEKNESPEINASFGLAMHGNPKYSPSSLYFDYVNHEAPKGGTLKTAVVGSFDKLNPFSLKGTAAQGLSYYYDRLMARVWDEPFTLYPLIAERADVAGDRSSIAFTLNPAARFHDGTPITADDVLFSFETLRDHGRPNMRRVYKLVDRAEKQGDRQVFFHLGPGYDRETVMILALMPVLSKKWWENRNFEETTLTPPLSSGPYRIKEVDSPRRIVYERVKDYWAADLLPGRGHNNFDLIIYDYYRDDAIALEALKKGDVNFRHEGDMAKWQNGYEGLDEIRTLRREIPHYRPERVQGFILNLRRPPLDDRRVRKALSLAFDAQWIGKNLFFGVAKRIDSFYPNSALNGGRNPSEGVRKLLQENNKGLPASAFEDDPGGLYDNRPLRQRLKEADRLLQDADWIIKDGVRIKAQTGQNLSLEVILKTPQDEKIAVNYARTLKKLGISLTIRLLDTANFESRRGQYDYDILMLYWQNTLSPGSEQSVYWSCESAKAPQGLNYAGVCNTALDRLAKDIADAKTYEDLTVYAQALDRILLAEYIIIPLFYTGLDYFAMDSSIHFPDNIPMYGAVTETLWMEPKNPAQESMGGRIK